MVTFRKAENIREIARVLPSDRLLLETDSPYLAPIPFRGKSNHPGYLGLVAANLARAVFVGIGNDLRLCDYCNENNGKVL